MCLLFAEPKKNKKWLWANRIQSKTKITVKENITSLNNQSSPGQLVGCARNSWENLDNYLPHLPGRYPPYYTVDTKRNKRAISTCQKCSKTSKDFNVKLQKFSTNNAPDPLLVVAVTTLPDRTPNIPLYNPCSSCGIVGHKIINIFTWLPPAAGCINRTLFSPSIGTYDITC